MRLFWRRRKPEPAPILSDRELQDLYSEIFDEPVSHEILWQLLISVPAHERKRLEWVMSTKTMNRIRKLHEGVIVHCIAETPDTLFGRPVVIDELAKLHVRVAA